MPTTYNVEMALEDIVAGETREKVMVVSDIHLPFQDNDAVEIMKSYAKDYKPNHFVINGDLLDFYNLSDFDKHPDRKYSVMQEIVDGRNFLKDMRKTVGKHCQMYMTEGNHDARLQRYLVKNPELADFPELKLPNLLRLKEQGIKYSGVSTDYWSKDTGHFKFGDMVVLHGDNRFNGASTSAYSGYSAKNTMFKLQTSVTMGHIHRLAMVHHRTPHGQMIGLEQGCLSQIPGNANWQQGFVTFDLIDGKYTENHRTHHINRGVLRDGDNIYYVPK